MLIKVFSVAEQASSRVVLEGGNRLAKIKEGLPGLVTKQQAVEFPQVLTNIYYFLLLI